MPDARSTPPAPWHRLPPLPPRDRPNAIQRATVIVLVIVTFAWLAIVAVNAGRIAVQWLP